MVQTLSADEFADLQAQLSKDFAWLLPRESGRRDPPLEVLLDRVADASGAPVLRDQGPIGRPGTARPMKAATPCIPCSFGLLPTPGQEQAPSPPAFAK